MQGRRRFRRALRLPYEMRLKRVGQPRDAQDTLAQIERKHSWPARGWALACLSRKEADPATPFMHTLLHTLRKTSQLTLAESFSLAY